MSTTSCSFNRPGCLASSAALGATSLIPVAARAAIRENAILPFRIDVSIRRRVSTTHWPRQETATDEPPGAQPATMHGLARHGETHRVWRKFGARLDFEPVLQRLNEDRP
jgi:hypothetical protein